MIVEPPTRFSTAICCALRLHYNIVLLGIGLGFSAWAFYVMTRWTPDVSAQEIIITGLVQGAGFGVLFVPMSAVTLSTLSPEDRADGASIFSLSRSIGSSVGISAFLRAIDHHDRGQPR
jgi:hypothetical protein